MIISMSKPGTDSHDNVIALIYGQPRTSLSGDRRVKKAMEKEKRTPAVGILFSVP